MRYFASRWRPDSMNRRRGINHVSTILQGIPWRRAPLPEAQTVPFRDFSEIFYLASVRTLAPRDRSRERPLLTATIIT